MHCKPGLLSVCAVYQFWTYESRYFVFPLPADARGGEKLFAKETSDSGRTLDYFVYCVAHLDIFSPGQYCQG